MALLEPMASISSPSAQTASFGRWAPTPCRRGFACPYLRRRCCFFGHSPEEVAAESEVGRDHLLPCRDDAAPAGSGLDGTSGRADRGCASAPDHEGFRGRCAARASGARAELGRGASVPDLGTYRGRCPARTTGARTKSCSGAGRQPVPKIKEHVPVPQTIEKLGDFVQPVPWERIQERVVEQVSLVPPDHGEKWASDSACAFGADPRTNRGADFCCASDH